MPSGWMRVKGASTKSFFSIRRFWKYEGSQGLEKPNLHGGERIVLRNEFIKAAGYGFGLLLQPLEPQDVLDELGEARGAVVVGLAEQVFRHEGIPAVQERRQRFVISASLTFFSRVELLQHGVDGKKAAHGFFDALAVRASVRVRRTETRSSP